MIPVKPTQGAEAPTLSYSRGRSIQPGQDEVLYPGTNFHRCQPTGIQSREDSGNFCEGKFFVIYVDCNGAAAKRRSRLHRGQAQSAATIYPNKFSNFEVGLGRQPPR